MPKQYINVGVAGAEYGIGLATGLGLEGKKVFVYSIGNFVSFRCLEQIRNDAAYHEIDLVQSFALGVVSLLDLYGAVHQILQKI